MQIHQSPAGGHGNPLQCSCLENPMDRGPGGLQSIALQRVRHDWSNLAHTYVSPSLQIHPTLHLTLSYPYICSLCLCLYFCFANRFICMKKQLILMLVCWKHVIFSLPSTSPALHLGKLIRKQGISGEFKSLQPLPMLEHLPKHHLSATRKL